MVQRHKWRGKAAVTLYLITAHSPPKYIIVNVVPSLSDIFAMLQINPLALRPLSLSPYYS